MLGLDISCESGLPVFLGAFRSDSKPEAFQFLVLHVLEFTSADRGGRGFWLADEVVLHGVLGVTVYEAVDLVLSGELAVLLFDHYILILIIPPDISV